MHATVEEDMKGHAQSTEQYAEAVAVPVDTYEQPSSVQYVPFRSQEAFGVEVAEPVDGFLPQNIGGPLGFVANRRKLVIKQQFQALEALAQGCGCSCCEWPNRYDLFDFDTKEHLAHIKEESDSLQRACCYPNHGLKLTFYDNRPGSSNTPVMISEKPCTCPCFALDNWCRPGLSSHVPNGPELGEVKMPFLGGGMTPTLEIMDRNKKVQSTVTGPTCCLGGIIEMCHSIKFDYHVGDSHGPVNAQIIKQKPSDFVSFLAEGLSKSGDVYVLDLPPDSTPEEAASMVAAALLLDYLFFENGPPVSSEGGGRRVNLCSSYCYGCLCTFHCKSDNNHH